MVDQAMGIETKYCLSDAVWIRVMPLLPAHRKRVKGGRPPMDDRKAMTAILYVLRTAANGEHFPGAWELGRRCTIDSSSGRKPRSVQGYVSRQVSLGKGDEQN